MDKRITYAVVGGYVVVIAIVLGKIAQSHLREVIASSVSSSVRFQFDQAEFRRNHADARMRAEEVS